jgi:uncharacterized protein (DUF305 family)
MIDHHAMALDMAKDCLAKGATPAVLELCQNVITAQTREIEVMRGWLLIWYGIEYHPMSMLDMHHMQPQGGMMQNGMGMGMMQDGMGMGMMGETTTAPSDPAAMPMDGMPMQGTVTPAAPGAHDQHHPNAGAAPASGAPAPMDMMDPQGMMGMMGWMHHHLTGVEYEIAWLEAMIDHHGDALHMSERIMGVTERPELDALAQGIIDAQTAEIALMEGMITELGG